MFYLFYYLHLIYFKKYKYIYFFFIQSLVSSAVFSSKFYDSKIGYFFKTSSHYIILFDNYKTTKGNSLI